MAKVKAHKYGAERTTVDGIVFPSKAEAARYGELKLMATAGAIHSLELQPEFPLEIEGVPIKGDSGKQLRYIGDFSYIDARSGERVIEDVKGHRTEGYRLKKAIMRAMGRPITEVHRARKGRRRGPLKRTASSRS